MGFVRGPAVMGEPRWCLVMTRHTWDASDMSLSGSRPNVWAKLQWRFGDVQLLVAGRICLGSHDLSG